MTRKEYLKLQEKLWKKFEGVETIEISGKNFLFLPQDNNYNLDFGLYGNDKYEKIINKAYLKTQRGEKMNRIIHCVGQNQILADSLAIIALGMFLIIFGGN